MSNSGLEPSSRTRAGQQPVQPEGPATPRRLRRAPSASQAAAAADPELLRSVRRFHLGGAGAGAGDAEDKARLAGCLPALLDAYRDRPAIRTDYPLVLAPAAGAAAADHCQPLGESLERAAAAAEVGRLVSDNLRRLERQILARLHDGSGVSEVEARSLLSAAAQAMEDELGLEPAQAATLHEELERLLDSFPDQAVLCGYDSGVALRLLAHAARERGRRIGTSWAAELQHLVHGLEAMLAVDRSKRPESRRAEGLGQSLGKAAGGLIDAGALATRLGARRSGPAAMDEGHRQRVEEALADLKTLAVDIEASGRGEVRPLLVVSDAKLRGLLPGDGGEGAAVDTVWADDPCAEVARRFDEAAAGLAGRLAGVRTARLEVEGAYDPERHDPWLAQFDWQAFSDAELRLLPPMAAVLSADLAAGPGMVSLSRLLLSGRPVQVLVIVDPAGSPGAENGGLASFRFEPGYLGISHREAFVSQVSSAHPLSMLAAFGRGIAARRTALHVVDLGAGAGSGAVSPVLVAGAAVEGRAHPFFCYDPEAGGTWARRFVLDGNPEPVKDWPVSELEVDGPGGEERVLLPFTFADFALLDPRFASCFRDLPEDLVDDDLVPLDRWLTLEGEEADLAVPYIWAADEQACLRRLAVTRELALACRDRLTFWHTLQELAGVHNEHVLAAEERVRSDWEGRLEELRSELEARHAAELEEVRSKAAEEVIEGLAASLLGEGESLVSLAAMAPGTAPVPAVPPASPPSQPAPPAGPVEAPAEPTAAAPAVEEEEDEGGAEPWIDTALCTSCNDCLNINPMMFAYNQDKKAYIKDPRAGTFEQLVLAAEKCPARVIHPGTPLDPSEENLDELVKRAAKFA